jgi:hypothetical protein
VEEMMKKLLRRLGWSFLLLGMSAPALWADNAEFRLVVSTNSGTVGGRFCADLEIKGTASRTLNSLTVDVSYSSELGEAAIPAENWFSGSGDYETSVSKFTLPGHYYRVLVTGNTIGKSGPGVPAGFVVTTSWQRVVTLCWDIATLSNSYSVDILTYTDAAAFFDNPANTPLADLTEWETSTLNLATVKLAARAFLQGPYDVNTHAMKTDLYSNALLPVTSVYTYDPRTVASVPAGSADWVLLQVRSSVGGPPIYSRSLFLRSDGQVIDNDGSESFDILSLEGVKSYYVVLRQRNHLAIMSASPITLDGSTVTTHDFTTAQNKAYGTNPMKAMSDGKFAMKAGDGNGDGGIDAIDINSAWRPNNGTAWSYSKYADFNLDGGIDAIDANAYWRPNNGSATQVP